MMPAKLLRLLPVLLCMALVMSCGDDPPPPIPGAGPGTGAPPTAGQPPPAGAAAAPAAPSKQLPEIELAEKDFKESANNRDPFRSFLGEFRPIARRVTRDDRKILLRRYGLDELTLIAVVTGRSVRPRAMFRDPNGLGVTVKRGQRVSKNAAKIKRILHNKVVVEIEEQSEDKTSRVDRIIELHPKEESRTQAGEDDEEGDASAVDQPVKKKGSK
jgi:Tfp pilus assembly protein PilP